MKPQFYPRAQFTGVLRWTCVYCARVNEHSIKPTAFKTKCHSCNRIIWWGPVAHIPAGPATKMPSDATIPVWAGDEYSFDPLKFDPMPEALFNPDKPIHQRERIAMLVIHDNIYYTTDELPTSEEAQGHERPEPPDMD